MTNSKDNRVKPNQPSKDRTVMTKPNKRTGESSYFIAEDLARKFHTLYEYYAPSYNYKTNKKTRDFDPESPNGRLMIAVCQRILFDMFRNPEV